MESKDWSGFGFFSPHVDKIKKLFVCYKTPSCQNLTVLKFKSDAKIKTKIRHDTICPLVLSREFWFCLLMQIAQIGTYESIYS